MKGRRHWQLGSTLGTVLALGLIGFGFAGCKKSEKSGVSVVGGVEDYNSFKATVGLKIIDNYNDTNYCTGTIVRENLIVTAAHCVARGWLQKIIVFEGLKDLERATADSSASPKYSEIIVYPLYSPARETHADEVASFKSDIAFVKFPAGTFAGHAMASFAKQAPQVGEDVRLVGYGDTDYSLSDSNPQFKRFSGSNKVYSIEARVAGLISLKTAEVGMKTSGLGEGDSGGPLFNSASELIGIASATTNLYTPDSALASNSSISKVSPYFSLYINVNDSGIAGFVADVMAGKRSQVPKENSQKVKTDSAPAATQFPSCKANNGQGYGVEFSCGGTAKCRKDSQDYSEASTCVIIS